MARHGDTEVKKRKKVTRKDFVAAIYDKKTGAVLGRTGKDWAFLLIFLILFYAVLFGYWVLLIFIFTFRISNDSIPFRSGDNSLIGKYPSLIVRPFIDNSGQVVVASMNVSTQSFKVYNMLTEQFIQDTIPANMPNGINCSDTENISQTKTSCMFFRSMLGPCSNHTEQLLNGNICAYLRINTIYGWLPSVKTMENTTDILVQCSPVTGADTVHMGQLEYYPFHLNNTSYGKFRSVYYPFKTRFSFWPPIVALRFNGVTKNVLATIVCSVLNANNVVGPEAISVYLADK